MTTTLNIRVECPTHEIQVFTLNMRGNILISYYQSATLIRVLIFFITYYMWG